MLQGIFIGIKAAGRHAVSFKPVASLPCIGSFPVGFYLFIGCNADFKWFLGKKCSNKARSEGNNSEQERPKNKSNFCSVGRLGSFYHKSQNEED